MSRVSVHVVTKDRHSEVALLLQSLRTQSFQDWDLVFVDDGSGTPFTHAHFLMTLIQRIRQEGHKVRLYRNDKSQGVCRARNTAIELDDFGNDLICRLDDDCLPDEYYLEELRDVIKYQGFDLVTGLIPLAGQPPWERDFEFVDSVMNRHVLNDSGEIVSRKDECAFIYSNQGAVVVVPTHQFRTNAMYKKELQDKIVARWGMVYPDYLSPVGFREEGFFSVKALALGGRLGVVLDAVAYHLQTPSGGCRHPNYSELVGQDDVVFQSFVKQVFKEYGNLFKEEKV